MKSTIARQSEVYVKGMMGQPPLIPVDNAELEKEAARHMSKEAYAYIAGGAGYGQTIKNNREGFNEFKIHPRMLRNVEERDTSIKLFGDELPFPMLISPVGVLEMAHKRADYAVGEAAAEMRVPYILSNQASTPMEKTTSVMGNSPRWFQLYWSKSNELVKSLLQRAEKSGASAIAVTLDTTLLGWRVQDLDLAYLPFSRGKGIAQYTSDPVFQKLMDEPTQGLIDRSKLKIGPSILKVLYEQRANYPGGFWKNLTSDRPMKAVQKFTELYSRPSIKWEELAFLRACTSLPIVLKGILHADDAQKALDFGVDGIIVSNHGGRQVDGSVSTIEVLPSIMDVVKDKIPVLLDSGVRGGADIFKALALGATACCIGRPHVYALAIAGAAGVKELISNYRTDFELTMALAGCKNVSEITRDCLL